MKAAAVLMWLASLASSGPMIPGLTGQAAVPEPGFARVEQWACLTENLDAVREYVDSVWAPIFDEMVREGLFSSWVGMFPVETRDVEFLNDGGAFVEEVVQSWNWMGIWQGGRQEAFEASWREYHRRLATAHPTGAGLEGLCTRVRVTTYQLGI